MKTTKTILIWSIVIGFLAQGFGQNKLPNTVQITGHVSGGLVMSRKRMENNIIQ